MYTVLIKNEAVEDTIEAYNYYEQKRVGLGEQFLEALKLRYTDLSLHPHHYSYIKDPHQILREVSIKNFLRNCV